MTVETKHARHKIAGKIKEIRSLLESESKKVALWNLKAVAKKYPKKERGIYVS